MTKPKVSVIGIPAFWMLFQTGCVQVDDRGKKGYDRLDYIYFVGICNNIISI